ncbi:MAG: hypothetical protein OHK0017_02940 [Patescibacteria group bacterium]
MESLKNLFFAVLLLVLFCGRATAETLYTLYVVDVETGELIHSATDLTYDQCLWAALRWDDGESAQYVEAYCEAQE